MFVAVLPPKSIQNSDSSHRKLALAAAAALR